MSFSYLENCERKKITVGVRIDTKEVAHTLSWELGGFHAFQTCACGQLKPSCERIWGIAIEEPPSPVHLHLFGGTYFRTIDDAAGFMHDMKSAGISADFNSEKSRQNYPKWAHDASRAARIIHIRGGIIPMLEVATHLFQEKKNVNSAS